jgi:class 3 adenylate cyclase/tetratricopeptide (TPR) repeat protein
MKCPRCQAPNDEGARFCEDCGARLEIACPTCGQPAGAGKKFCRSCGAALTTDSGRFTSPGAYTPKHLAEKILTSKSALEGERKQVTVLFADLKGSMELLADRDPEEARKILDPVLEHMMEAVHRYEGTVNQVMGDGIMALFGAPIAHEDHAVRACYAALRMQESVKKYADEVLRTHGVVKIRVGLNSGEVVVRSVGSDLRMDYTAVGQTTHLAARMEQLATPGSIRLTAETLYLAEGFVQVTPLGPVPIKGLGESVEVFELVGAGAARTRLEAAARRGFTRFVGRIAELEQLRSALDLASLGHGQVVAVVGEPGVGKSRLFWELLHTHRVHGWLVAQSASVSYGKATAYLPVIELLRRYFEIESRDDQRKIREKVTGKVLTLAPALGPVVPALLALLDVPADEATWQILDPLQRRQQTLDAVKRLLLHEAEVQPLVVVFEDLQWIDGETQTLLDSLVESLPTARLLLLVNYRPQYQHTWGGKSYYRQLQIDPLPPESADELLDALLGPDAALGPLKKLLVERTEANPLFLEESVRALVETQALTGERGAHWLTRPVEQLTIPATVKAILAARIDRLEPEAKRLLQAAAVIGKDVAMPLLLVIADAPESEVRAELTHLQAAEFLYETHLFPDLEYTFKHALTHDVAYGGLLRERRRELHARIVDAIEGSYPDRLSEHVEQLAHHALDGEVWEKAATYLRQAGTKALARSAYREAVAHLERALKVLAHLPNDHETLAQALDVRFDLRNALQPLAEFGKILDNLDRARALAEDLGDRRRLGRVFAYLTDYYRLTGDQTRAIDSGERALAIGEALGDLELCVSTQTWLGQVYYHCGEYRRAVAFFSKNLGVLVGDRAHERLGLPQLPAIHSRTCLAWCFAALGEFTDGSRRGEEAMRIAESMDHPLSRAVASAGLGTLYVLKGNAAAAIALLEPGLQASRVGNIPLWFPELASVLGNAYALSGRLPEALTLLEQAVDQANAMGLTVGQAMRLTRFAEAYLLARRLGEAMEVGLRALERARENHEEGYEAWSLRLLSEIVLRTRTSALDDAESHGLKALALAKQLGMRPLVAHCHAGLAKLYRRTGKRQEADDHLTTATTMYREMGMTYWLEKAETSTLN